MNPLDPKRVKTSQSTYIILNNMKINLNLELCANLVNDKFFVHRQMVKELLHYK